MFYYNWLSNQWLPCVTTSTEDHMHGYGNCLGSFKNNSNWIDDYKSTIQIQIQITDENENNKKE